MEGRKGGRRGKGRKGGRERRREKGREEKKRGKGREGKEEGERKGGKGRKGGEEIGELERLEKVSWWKGEPVTKYLCRSLIFTNTFYVVCIIRSGLNIMLLYGL